MLESWNLFEYVYGKEMRDEIFNGMALYELTYCIKDLKRIKSRVGQFLCEM